MFTLILSLIFSNPAAAEVLAIASSRTLLVPRAYTAGCRIGTLLSISSQDKEGEVLGYARITGPAGNEACAATVESHSRAGLIRQWDRTDVLDLSGKNERLPGGFYFLQEGQPDVAVRYKPLVYAGYGYGQTAATLDKGEFLVGLGPLLYGVTDNLQVDTSPLEFLSGTGQLGVKYQFLRGEDMKLSLRLNGRRFFAVNRGAWGAELQYDSLSSATFMSHTKLSFTSKLPDSLFLSDRDKEKQGTAELSTTYEWVLPSWHRLLLGPKFTAGESKDLGLIFSALFLYEHFHWSLNAEVNSLAKFNLKEYKQVFSFDLFWRF